MKKIILGIFLGAILVTGVNINNLRAVEIQYSFQNNLSIGSTGEDVIRLQTFLESNGLLMIPVGISKGYFGSLTKMAVIKYQISKGIAPAVGYVGPLTRSAINSTATSITLKITPDVLSDAKTNKLYTQVLKSEGFSGPMTWEIVSGALPEGFSLGKNETSCPAIYPSNCVVTETYQGLIAGYTITRGEYNFTVKVSDGSKSITKSYTLIVKNGFSISTNKQSYSKNEQVIIKIKAFNESDVSQTLRFTSGCQASYRINRANNPGDNVYDSLQNQMCTAGLTGVTIPASGFHEWTLTHPANTLSAGTYEIFGSIIGNAFLQPIKIVIIN